MANEVDGTLRVRVRRYADLFNEIDASPFQRRDLNDDVREYLVDWAADLPRGVALSLTVEIIDSDGLPVAAEEAAESIQAHFQREAASSKRHLRRLIRDGRISLVVGLAFLACMLLANEAFATAVDSPRLEEIAETGFIVAGWVALWRPMEIFLYDWWPLLRQRRLHERMGGMPVTFRRAG